MTDTVYTAVLFVCFPMMLFSNIAQAGETPRVIELRISAGEVAGGGVVRLTQGEHVEIHWTADDAVDIHLHGYDIERTVEPGSSARMIFEAYATGRFPVTVHGSAHSHGHDERSLVYLEVYPE